MKKSLIETSLLIKKGDLNLQTVLQSSNKSLQKLLNHNLFLELDEEKILNDHLKSEKKNSSLISDTLISVKDNFMVKGTRTSAGSRILDNLIAPYDATVIRSLKDKGAVIYGKTNLDEFGMGSSTSNSAYGSTLNPWNQLHNLPIEDVLSPGGSSGGSAGAVASYLCQGAIGSDTGGSVRQPASFCGVVGFKPSYGALSRHGLIAYASSFDCPGVLTRSVLDSAVLFDAMYSGRDLNDPSSVDLYSNNTSSSSLFNSNQPLSSLLSSSTSTSTSSSTMSVQDTLQSLLHSQQTLSRSLEGIIVGVPIEFSLTELDSQVRSHWNETLRLLTDAGASIQTISLPSLRLALPAYYLLACAEASSNLSRYDGIRFGSQVNSSEVSSKDTTEKIQSVANELHSQMSLLRGQLFGSQVNRRILAGTYVLSESAYEGYYSSAVLAREMIINELSSTLRTTSSSSTSSTREGQVDCIVGPTSPTLPFYLTEQPNFADMLMGDFMTVPANLGGIPAISVPVGTAIKQRRSDSSRSLNVPVGMQIMAGRGCEEIVFRAALAIEQRAGFQLCTTNTTTE